MEIRLSESSTPYKPQEKLVMDYLVKAWEAFCVLEKTHPSHNKDFGEGIHKCQDVIIYKIVQRDYPETFPSYGGNNDI